MQELTQARLKQQLSYDPETGIFVWLAGQRTGKIAGCLNTHGYVQIKIGGKFQRAHRLAWLYVHGRFPSFGLDHINVLRTDNRISNLRECTGSENYWNVPIKRTNTSGFKGVCWNKRKRKWMAQISINKKRTYIGLFATPELASAAYEAKARELHGEFYRATL